MYEEKNVIWKIGADPNNMITAMYSSEALAEAAARSLAMTYPKNKYYVYKIVATSVSYCHDAVTEKL